MNLSQIVIGSVLHHDFIEIENFNLKESCKSLDFCYNELMECRFCKISNGNSDRIIHSTRHTFTVLSDPRLTPGHILVIPRRHVEKLSELSKEEKADLLEEVVNLQEKILKKIAPGCDICQHYRPFIPDNKLEVNHLHIHLRPRELNDELYEKVQIFEKDVFKDIEDKKLEKYKEMLKS